MKISYFQMISMLRLKKNLKEYKTKKLQKELADAISKIPSDQESAIFEQNELFLDLTTNY